MKNTALRYGVISEEVLHDNTLSTGARLLYAEIFGLSAKTGYCTETNAYFAKGYNISKKTVQRYLTQLKEAGYLDIQYTYKDTKELEARTITALS